MIILSLHQSYCLHHWLQQCNQQFIIVIFFLSFCFFRFRSFCCWIDDYIIIRVICKNFSILKKLFCTSNIFFCFFFVCEKLSTKSFVKDFRQIIDRKIFTNKVVLSKIFTIVILTLSFFILIDEILFKVFEIDVFRKTNYQYVDYLSKKIRNIVDAIVISHFRFVVVFWQTREFNKFFEFLNFSFDWAIDKTIFRSTTKSFRKLIVEYRQNLDYRNFLSRIDEFDFNDTTSNKFVFVFISSILDKFDANLNSTNKTIVSRINNWFRVENDTFIFEKQF